MSVLSLRSTEGQGLMMSLALHIAVAAGAWVTVPFLSRELPEESPIIVELVPIDEITAAPARPVPVVEEKPEPKPEQKPEPPKPADAEKPQPDQMPPPDEQPAPPPPQDVAEAPPPPKTPPPPKPKPKPKKDDWAELQALVKNLEKKESAEEKQQETQTAAVDSQAKVITRQLADRATMTELDAIRRHIEGCWRIDPGKEGIEDLSAEIKVFINPDGSVQQAQIADMGRYFADAQFRTFANSARNAVLSCGNLPVSPQRYETFKEISFTFSPQGRIN
jgi:outer membrane biosynthesis protein TonB